MYYSSNRRMKNGWTLYVHAEEGMISMVLETDRLILRKYGKMIRNIYLGNRDFESKEIGYAFNKGQ